MRTALLIFRKDVRHLWPRVIPVLAVTALLGWMECELYALKEPLRLVWLVAAAFLVVSVFQQEALPGHQQYWLTRPYHRGHLFLSKALFLAVFAWLPILAIEAISLAVNGLPWWRHIPLLLGTTLFFMCWACLIVAALASVSENLMQFLWGFLPASGVVILGFILASTGDQTGNWQWDRLEWMRDYAMGIVVLAAAITVIFLQYSFRKTAVSRCLLGGAILFAATGPFLGSWHAAWTVESKISGPRLEGSAVRIAFDPAPRPALSFADSTWSPGLGEAGVNLPIAMTGIPAGMEVVCERIMARIEAPDGRSWASNMTRVGGVYSTTPLEDPYVVRADGPYWQYVNVEEQFFRSVKNTPVHVHTTVALTLLGERRISPLAKRDRSELRAGEGLCRVDPGPFGKLIVSCAWLGSSPARSYVVAKSLRNGQTYASLLSTGSGSPFPMRGSIWESTSTLFSAPATEEMQLETWQAVAHFERDLDLPQVRLADYAVRRITDMP
jgi:hypothetical protein